MPYICYVEKTFRKESAELINIADQICRDYADEGLDITLRQLYYQFVARDILPNSNKSYTKLKTLVSNARLAGLLNWSHLVDRTRSLKENSHWDCPADIIESAAASFQLDKWAGQQYRVEVWVEKEALVGVIEKICEKLDVPFFACRGYVSQSEMWRAAERIRHRYCGDDVVILHLGDHDPSGIDMTRDIKERLELFEAASSLTVDRIALNREQIEEFNPPPNPAKFSDPRAEDYVKIFGEKSWELDAIEPKRLMSLIEHHVDQWRDKSLFDDVAELERENIESLQNAADRWDDVCDFLEGGNYEV